MVNVAETVQPTAEKRQHEATGEQDRNGLLLLYRTELPAAERRQRGERSDRTERSKRRPPAAGAEEISIQHWRR